MESASEAASDDLVGFARAAAPHVDRLAVAVHRHARPQAGELLRAYGLRMAGVLIDARAILLAGPIAVDDLAVLERSAPREELGLALDEHVRQGLLARDELAAAPRYAPTARGRDLLLRLTALQGQAIAALWAAHADLLPGLASAAARLADRAAATLPRDSYPAFHGQQAAPLPPDGSPAHLLLARLTALRYLRADAHANAWAAQGLDAAGIVALTALWHAEAPRTPAELAAGRSHDGDALILALESLRGRGLAEQQGGRWRISAAGRALRDEIEAATDRGAAPPFAALDAPERAAFLHGLALLPD